MKIKSILTAIAVALSTLVHPVLASNWTFDKNGEPTHYKGIPIPPMQTVEQARAATEKRLAAIKAEEAKQAAEGAVSSNQQSEIGNHQLFYTGKPYLEETGQYLFLFRHYDPELARWTTADPSGFPDGANNHAYLATPLTMVDPNGLEGKSVAWISCYYNTSDPDEYYGIYLQVSGVTEMWRENMQIYDRNSVNSGNPTHYLDDGDSFWPSSIGALSDLGAFSNVGQLYIFAHGIFDTSKPGNPFLGYGVGNQIYQAQDFYNSASNVMWVMGCTEYNHGLGNENTSSIANNFITPTLNYLYE